MSRIIGSRASSRDSKGRPVSGRQSAKDRAHAPYVGVSPKGRQDVPETLRRDECGGADRDRTDDLRLAKPALSQLSYSPTRRTRVPSSPGREGRRSTDRAARRTLRSARASSLEHGGGPVVGLGGFEPPTSRLSGGRSNQLSYRPGDRPRSSEEPQRKIRTVGSLARSER